MISKFRDFVKISFVQDVGILEIGKFLSIILSVVSSVILARLLHPELYGVYGLIFAFVGLVGIFMNWGGMYAGLTLLAEASAKRDKQEIKNVLTYFIKITLLAFCFIGIFGIFLAPFLTELLYDNIQIGHWARVVLLAGFLNVIYGLLVIVLQVFRKIKQLTILETLNKFVYSLLPIIFIYAGWGLVGVVWGHFVSAFIFLILAIFLYFSLVSQDKLLPGLGQIFLNFKAIKLKKYFNFGFSIAVDKNLSSLISLLPVVFLGIFAPAQEVGYLKIALGYIAIPSIILEPVSRLLTVQLPKSRAYDPQLLKEHFLKTTFYSGLISVLLLAPFIVLASFLVKLFYGAEYAFSVRLIYYLSALIVFFGFSVGISAFYRTVNRIKTSIAINISHIISIILLIFILARIFNPLTAVILSIIISAALFLVLHLLAIRSILKK